MVILRLTGQRYFKMKILLWVPRFPREESRLRKLLSCKYTAVSGKERISQGDRAHSPENRARSLTGQWIQNPLRHQNWALSKEHSMTPPPQVGSLATCGQWKFKIVMNHSDPYNFYLSHFEWEHLLWLFCPCLTIVCFLCGNR